MGVIYLPFIIILTALIFMECRKKGQKKWWAAIVFLCPPVSGFVLSKTRTQNKIIFIVLPLILLSMVLGAEWMLYSHRQSLNAEDNTPPILKKMLELNEDVKQTTIEIYNASGKLDSISMVQSRITDIKSSIETIAKMRDLVDQNQQAIDRLVEFTQEHEIYFYRKNLDWIFSIRNFYNDPNVINHHQSRSNYLAAYETLMTYTYENFNNIMELKSQRHMKSYDAYYMRYRRAADSHNRFNRKRIAFQNEFIEKFPEVKPFLPGSHHLEPFKFWDKFSF